MFGKVGPTSGTASPASPASSASMSAKDADDAGDAGDVVHYGHPPKNTRFLTPRGDAQKAAKNRLNKSGNPSPLIRVGPAWRRAKVRHMVGGGSAAWGGQPYT